MEKMEMKSYSSQAKLLGTIVSVAGAFVINFYKGPPIISHLLSSPTANDHFLLSTHSNWILGGFLFAIAAFLLSLLFIVQAWIMKDYPAELMVTLVGCIFVTIQSTLVALIAEKHPNAWKIAVNLELATIFYSAIVVCCLRSVVYTWAIRLKGPVFVTIFKPLEMVIAVVLGVTFLRDCLHIGSVIGAAIIAVGFYAVMWGKAKESKTIDDEAEDEISSSHSSSHKDPLLQAKNMNV